VQEIFEEKYPEQDGKDYLDYFIYQNILGIILSLILSKLIGPYADSINIKVSMPIMHLIRAVVFYLSYLIDDPKGIMFWIVVPLQSTSI